MKYIYNPITGTLDDVETPNLGEKYFASAETDALKDMMNEQFGPGTIKYGSEIPQPEMKTPQAIYEFGQRNPAANGGMIGRINFGKGGSFRNADGSYKPINFAGKKISFPNNWRASDDLKYTYGQVEASIRNDSKKLNKWLKNPTPKNWIKLGLSKSQFARNLRAYLLDQPIDPRKGTGLDKASKELFDQINIKKLFKPSDINKINELTTGGKGKSLKSIAAKTLGNLKYTMEETIETIKNFQNGEQWLRRNPDPDAVDADGKNKYRKYANAIKSMEAERLKIGGFPFGDNSEKKLWSNLYRASYRGNRIQIVGEFADGNLPINEKEKIDWKMKDKNGVQAWKRIQFVDTQAPKNTTFTWGDNFQRGDFAKQVDNTFGEGFFKKSTEAYDTQVKTGSKRDFTKEGGGKTIKSDLKTKILTIEALIDNPKATKKDINKYIKNRSPRFNITEVHHPDGVGVNPWKTEPTFRYANRALDKEVMQPLKAGTIDINEAKLRIDKINNEIGPIRVMLDDGYYGKYLNTQKSIVEAAKNYANKIKSTLSPKLKSTLTNRLNSGLPIDSILSTIANDLDIPVEQVKNVAGKTLRGLGKAAVVVDPIFAALDFSEAKGKGVSGSEATKYTVGRFFEGIANLPGLAKGAIDYGVDKFVEGKEGEDLKFETPYEVTFAQDYLKRKIEETPEEVLKARQAKIEFDNTILSNMTMVDDMEIPASKEEIDAAEKEFMDARGVDLSILDNLEKLEKDKDVTFMGIDMDNSVSKSMNQMLATGGRVNFQDGTPNPQLEGDDFLNQLEFKFNNIDNVTLDDTPITFDDSKSSAAQVADLFNPKNIPYYADVAVRAGLRVGEFGTRILPATGQLISDVLQKPMFKVKSSYLREDDNEILDYGETPENNNVKFVGGPIFKNFLKNITPTSTEKLVGLDTLINEEKKKMIERGSSSLPVKVAETAALGGELIAPIFPGLKLLRAYAKSKSLPVNDDTKQLLEQDVDMVLESNGMDRRQFLQITGTGGAVILAKMLGFGDEFATATKVAEKATAEAVSTYPPPYFFKLVEKINSMGDDITKKAATQEREIVKSYKDYEMTEDLATGEIVIRKRNEGSFYDQDGIISDEYIVYKPGQADELTKGKTPPAEYDEYTVRPDSDGKLTDSEDGLDSIEEILEEVGDPDSLTLKR